MRVAKCKQDFFPPFFKVNLHLVDSHAQICQTWRVCIAQLVFLSWAVLPSPCTLKTSRSRRHGTNSRHQDRLASVAPRFPTDHDISDTWVREKTQGPRARFQSPRDPRATGRQRALRDMSLCPCPTAPTLQHHVPPWTSPSSFHSPLARNKY